MWDKWRVCKEQTGINIHQTDNQEKQCWIAKAAYWRHCTPLSGENELKKELKNVCVSLNPAPVHLKPTQYRKSTLLQNKTAMNAQKINLQQDHLWPTPQSHRNKSKNKKWDLIKLKSFCTTKESISKVKRQPSQWEKKTANEATDKELISKIYKQLLQLNSRKINDPIKKWAKDLNRHFSKEDIDGKQTHEKMLNITHYQRNANQNHNELPSHSAQDSCYQKVYKQ